MQKETCVCVCVCVCVCGSAGTSTLDFMNNQMFYHLSYCNLIEKEYFIDIVYYVLHAREIQLSL